MSNKTSRTGTVKTPVRLRKRALKDGSQSLYLDININGNRHTETLDFKLEHEATAAAKARNKEVMRKVNAIVYEKNADILSGRANFVDYDKRGKVNLGAYIDRLIQRGSARNNSYPNLKAKLRAFDGLQATLGEIDKDYILNFVQFLRGLKSSQSKQPLTTNCIVVFVSAFKVVMKYAAAEDLILKNPFDKIDRHELPKRVQSKERERLTDDELERLIATSVSNKINKQAFLFSCFTGLRFSDIKALKWTNITDTENGKSVIMYMQKTREPVEIPLTEMAISWLPDPVEGKELVFDGMAKTNGMNGFLQRWLKEAGITRRVSFHVARHTFAYRLIERGVTIDKICKFLGHTSLQTTMVYARPSREALRAAIEMGENERLKNGK